MVDPITVGLLAGGGSLLSGLFSSKSASKTNKLNIAAQQAAIARQEELDELAYDAMEREAERARDEFQRTQSANRDEFYRVDNQNRAEHERVNSANRADVERVNAENKRLGEEFIGAGYVDIKELVQDAERGGFNPLTYLRSGAAALYSKTVNLPGYSMMSPVSYAASAYTSNAFQMAAAPGKPTRQPGAQVAPVLSANVPSTASAVAGAVNDGFSAFMTQQRLVDSQTFQEQLLQKQIAGIAAARSAGKAGSASFNVPGIIGSGGAKKGAVTGLPIPAETGKKEVTNPWNYFGVDPTTADAGVKTQRYGESELAETMFFLDNSFNDFWFNVTGLTAPQRWEKTKSFFNTPLTTGPLPSLGMASPTW